MQAQRPMFVRLLAVVVLGLVATACSSSDGDTPADTDVGAETGDDVAAGDREITVWQFGSPQAEREYYLERNAEFEEQTGITVHNEMFDWDERHQQVALAAGGDNLPDVLVIENSMLAELSSEEIIVPIADLTDDAGQRADAWSESYVPALWDLGKYEDTLYGFSPYVDLSPNLIYNDRLLDEAGISPPETWSDLLEAAEALTTEGRYGIAFGSLVTLDVDILESIAYGNGARWLDPDTGEPAVAGAGWIDTLEFMRDLAGFAPPGITDQNFRDALQLFYSEQAAMVLSKSFTPIIAQDYDVPTDFPESIAAFPRPDQVTGAYDPTDFVGQAALLFTPTRSVRDAEAVVDYLEFWAQPEQHTGWDGSEIFGRVPSTWEVLQSDTWAEQYPALAPNAEEIFRAVEPLPVFPDHAAVQEELRQAFQSVLLGSIEPEQAVEQVAQSMQ